MVRPAYLVAVEMSAAHKTELRTYVARTLDDQYDTDEITTWINDVGQIMGKQDIIDDAQNVATYLMEEKGYQTGEEFDYNLGSLTAVRHFSLHAAIRHAAL